MIAYSTTGSLVGIVSCKGVSLTLRNFKQAATIATLFATIGALFKILELFVFQAPLITQLLVNDFFATLTGVVALLLSFRTVQAYGRFWDGCTNLYGMQSEWLSAVSTLVSFCNHSTVDKSVKDNFQQILVRLVSLLNAMIFSELEGVKEGEEHQAHDFELIDAAGLDVTSISATLRERHKPELVFQWIQSLIVQNIKTDVLTIPPPLLTRTFQEMDQGMVKYHEAMRFADVPFPFPYVATLEVLLCIHSCLAPVTIAAWSDQIGFTVIFTWIIVFGTWCLHLVALELDNPFGHDQNDLDLHNYQLDLNQKLVMLVGTSAGRVPQLSLPLEDAINRAKELSRGRGSAHFRSTFRSLENAEDSMHVSDGGGNWRSFSRQESLLKAYDSIVGEGRVNFTPSVSGVYSSEAEDNVSSGGDAELASRVSGKTLPSLVEDLEENDWGVRSDELRVAVGGAHVVLRGLPQLGARVEVGASAMPPGEAAEAGLQPAELSPLLDADARPALESTFSGEPLPPSGGLLERALPEGRPHIAVAPGDRQVPGDDTELVDVSRELDNDLWDDSIHC